MIAGRLAVQLGHGAAGDQLAFLDDADAVADLLGDADAVRREKNRRAVFCQRTKEIFERARAARVHADHRLVDDQDARFMNQRGADDQPLFHAMRVAFHELILPGAQLQMLEQLR